VIRVYTGARLPTPKSQPNLADAASNINKAASSPAGFNTKALQEHVLTKWAGPGFSLPPTPDALPMPSKSLLTCRPKCC
jgi:hypothetical protein